MVAADSHRNLPVPLDARGTCHLSVNDHVLSYCAWEQIQNRRAFGTSDRQSAYHRDLRIVRQVRSVEPHLPLAARAGYAENGVRQLQLLNRQTRDDATSTGVSSRYRRPHPAGQSAISRGSAKTSVTAGQSPSVRRAGSGRGSWPDRAASRQRRAARRTGQVSGNVRYRRRQRHRLAVSVRRQRRTADRQQPPPCPRRALRRWMNGLVFADVGSKANGRHGRQCPSVLRSQVK